MNFGNINPLVQFANDASYSWPYLTTVIDQRRELPARTLTSLIEPQAVVTPSERWDAIPVRFIKGSVSIARMSARGVNADQSTARAWEKEFYLDCPHYSLIDDIRKDSLSYRTPLGAGDPRTLDKISNRVNEIADTHNDVFDQTVEFNWAKAIQGKIYDGATNEYRNMFDEFGVAEQTYTLNQGADNANDVVSALLEAKQMCKSQINEQNPTSYLCICSWDFYYTLKRNKKILEDYRRWEDGKFLIQAFPEGFSYQGIEFIPYDRYSTIDGVNYFWIPAGTARLLPVGVKDLYQKVNAPSDIIETPDLNAISDIAIRETVQTVQDRYYRTWLEPNGLCLHMTSQMNQFCYMSRPQASIKMVLGSPSAVSQPVASAPSRNLDDLNVTPAAFRSTKRS